MKKLVILLLALCLGLGGAVAYLAAKNGDAVDLSAAAGTVQEAAETEEESPAAGEETAPIEIAGIDYGAIRALHEPDEIVGTIEERAVTWEEYFFWLHQEGTEMEQYLQTLAAYGQQLDWSDKPNTNNEMTVAELAVAMAEDYLKMYNVAEAAAAEKAVTLTAEEEDELAAQQRQTITETCGEGAGEEEFNAFLEENLISRAIYERCERVPYLYQALMREICGERGEKTSDEETLAYLNDNEYLCAAHILFLTKDLSSNETLDEETVEAKKQQAAAVAEELRAIEDAQERAARFAELKEQYCEDSGKTLHPDGYLFKPGTMVTEFEDGAKALGEYEVSEPILSGYGYHVIMRLPLSADMATMEYSESGEPKSARELCASAKFETMMSGRMSEAAFVPAEGFSIDLTAYLVRS